MNCWATSAITTPELSELSLAIPPDIYAEYAGRRGYAQNRSNPLLTAQVDYQSKTVDDVEFIINRGRCSPRTGRPIMTVYHAKTDPDLLTRLRQMLGSSARADIAVGYFFMSGFAEVVDDLARLNKTPHPGGARRPAHAGSGGRRIAPGRRFAGPVGR